MISKFLERKIELVPDENEKNLFYPINLEYYLVESDMPGTEDLDVEKVYGIEIVKKAEGKNTEVGLVKNFSCCRESTREVLMKLADNTVTPVGLPFILDDMIGV